MITSETSYKLAEIIRETWPGLYTLSDIESNIKINKQNIEYKNGFEGCSSWFK